MKEEWKKVMDKLDIIDSRVDNIDITLAKQEVNLREHMRRTELLEKQHEVFNENFKPINAHVNQIKGGMKFVGALSAIAALAGVIFKIIEIT